jgi:hypothetical protein
LIVRDDIVRTRHLQVGSQALYQLLRLLAEPFGALIKRIRCLFYFILFYFILFYFIRRKLTMLVRRDENVCRGKNGMRNKWGEKRKRKDQ